MWPAPGCSEPWASSSLTKMDNSFDSTERTAADFVLFAMGFLGFLLSATGIVVDSPVTAIGGGLLLVFAVAAFAFRR